MRIEKHAERTRELFGWPAEDIHEWLDQFFDKERFRRSLRKSFLDGYNPYSHRKYLHYREALPLAVEEFRGRYSEEVVRLVFFQHLMDDYDGYIPSKADFSDENFIKKYHRLRIGGS